MEQNVFIPTRTDLEEIVKNAVRGAIAEIIPKAIRQATRKEWLTTEEVMNILSVSRRTLQYYRDFGKIEYSRNGRKILFHHDSVYGFLRENIVKKEYKQNTKRQYIQNTATLPNEGTPKKPATNDTHLSELPITIRAYNSLLSAGYNTVGDILSVKYASDLRKIRNFGRQSYENLKHVLSEHGVKLDATW